MKKNVIKKESPHELLLAFAVGLTPNDMVAKGYNVQTVYRYGKFYERAKKNFSKKFGASEQEIYEIQKKRRELAEKYDKKKGVKQ